MLQFTVFGLEGKNKTFFGGIPAMFAVIVSLPTLVKYAEMQSLIDSEGYSYLIMPVADRVFIHSIFF